MFFKRKSTILFRDYQDFGYITDNRNFGYIQKSSTEDFIGDKIISESGSVFMSVLDRQPQSIDDLVLKISQIYTETDLPILRNDAIEFYSELELEGFVISGRTIQECDLKDKKFSYKNIKPRTNNMNFPSSTIRPRKTTQDFFDNYFNGKPQLTNLHIEITNKCNERCIHCYIPHEDKINQMEPYLFNDILDQSINMKLLNLTISGGEPMLHKNFCDFLRKCNETGFSVNVLSNLTLLNTEIVNEMKMNPLLSVQVSLYSMDSKIHDEITQLKGSFEKTKNAILKLVENNIPLQISCPIMKQNKDCYFEVINWAKNLNINVGDDFGIIAEYNNTNQNLNCRLSLNEISTILNEKIENDREYLEQIEKEALQKKNISPTDLICSVCSSTICIAENGDVYPCEGWQSYAVGNIKETSLQNIWANSDKVQYLRGLRHQDFPKCIQCADKEFCTMCLVRNANENPTGNPLGVNEFFCGVAKLKRKATRDWTRKR